MVWPSQSVPRATAMAVNKIRRGDNIRCFIRDNLATDRIHIRRRSAAGKIADKLLGGTLSMAVVSVS